MKKIYSLALAMFLSAGAFAEVDETFVFTNSKGEVIANGTTITVNNYEDDEFQGLLFHSGLYVTNNTDAGAYASMTVEVSKIDNGKLQHCFPGNCNMFSEEGTYRKSESQPMQKGDSFSIQSEWIPEEKGSCTVTYTIRVMSLIPGFAPKYEDKAEGPSVTVNYIYDDNSQDAAAGIAQLTTTTTDSRLYNLSGQAVDSQYRGLVIKNGRKHLMK